MNISNSCFLCLDIGTTTVRGMAHRIHDGRIIKSAMAQSEEDDPIVAITTVVDDLEQQIGGRLGTAYVTGNFGDMIFDVTATQARWRGAHKITATDIRAQVAQIPARDGFHPMHIIPLRYDGAMTRNMSTPIGHTDTALVSLFADISYGDAVIAQLMTHLRRAHIQTAGLFDPTFLLATALPRGKGTHMLIDMGAAYTTVGLWTARGPVWIKKIPGGQSALVQKIADTFHISPPDAARVRRMISIPSTEMDRFTPADVLFDFSRADVADVILPEMEKIIEAIKSMAGPFIAKYRPQKILLYGGAAAIDGMTDYVSSALGMPVENLGADAAVRALGQMIWAMQAPRIRRLAARRERLGRIGRWFMAPWTRRSRPAARPIPIMPSTLAFDMHDDTTYSLFRAAGISMIHVDIMDGFFVSHVAGGIDELKYIRNHSAAHLSVHLMTESPAHWAIDTINAGADTVIISAGTAGVREAITQIHRRGRRAGIAISPDMSLGILKDILRDLDVVLVMSVRPGAGGQEFMPSALRRIATLRATRQKYNLKFEICVDGGINEKTAPSCWDAGADTLVAGSYLARATDFPLAVMRLMPGRKK